MTGITDKVRLRTLKIDGHGSNRSVNLISYFLLCRAWVKTSKLQHVASRSTSNLEVNMKNTNKVQQSSLFSRTSLEERLQFISGGRELIAVTLLPRILPIAYPTIKNKISAHTFPLEIIRFNNKNYVRTADVIAVILNESNDKPTFTKKVGRKSNKDRLQSISKSEQ